MNVQFTPPTHTPHKAKAVKQAPSPLTSSSRDNRMNTIFSKANEDLKTRPTTKKTVEIVEKYWTYQGSVNANGQFHDIGDIVYKNESSYIGTFENGLYEGNGTYISTQGDIYNGLFKEGSLTSGKVTYSNVEYGGMKSYEGEFDGSAPHGQGSAVYHDDSTYTGRFIDGEMETALNVTSSSISDSILDRTE